MVDNVIGKIPDFAEDSSAVNTEEVVQPTDAAPEEEVVQEKETPTPPVEKPTNEEIVGEVPSQDQRDEAIKGLQDERVKLLKEISELRGTRRELKQEQVLMVEKQIDDLKDVNPGDVDIIDRVLRAKGFVTKQEASGMFYEAVKNEELNKFLEKYPEYKPENDPTNTNWDSLQRELGYYKSPNDPHKIREVLERAHRGIIKVPTAQRVPAQRRQIEVASVGSGGVQRAASPVSNPRLSSLLKTHMQGFSDEELKTYEQKLE